MRLVSWLLLPPAAILVIAIAIDNRDPVTLSFYPLPWEMQTPLYAVLFAGIVIGLAIGLVGGWWRARRWRSLARQQRQETVAIGRELARLKAQKLDAETKQLPPPVTAA